MPVEKLAANHLDADEGEQHTEAVVEHPEAVGHIAQKEEERAQSHDSEDIGGIDNDRILGHRENGRNGVDGEDDVGEFDDQQHEEKRRYQPFAIFADEEVVAVAFGAHGEVLGGELHYRMVRRVYLLVTLVEEHLHTAVNQYHTKDGQQPSELADEASKDKDEDKPEHDSTEDAPEEHPMIVLLLDAEGDENHNHHEDIVYREALLEEIAGKELLDHLATIGSEVGHRVIRRHHPVAEEVDQHSESHGQADPDSGPQGCLLHAHHLILLMEHKKVEHQHDDHEDHEDSKKQSVHIQ